MGAQAAVAWQDGRRILGPITEDEPRTAYGDYGTGKAEIEALLHRETLGGGVPSVLLHPGHLVVRLRGADQPAEVDHGVVVPPRPGQQVAVEEIRSKLPPGDDRHRWVPLGHLLLEGVPGLAKTRTIATLAQVLGASGIRRALYAGDDRTDIDAFRALGTMLADGKLEAAVRIGIRSAEGPPDLGDEADLLVDGPEGLLTVLRGLLGSAG
jgi:hypothetical protein